MHWPPRCLNRPGTGGAQETQTQAMIGEETCASHELSSRKIMAEFSEPLLNRRGLEERSTLHPER